MDQLNTFAAILDQMQAAQSLAVPVLVEFPGGARYTFRVELTEIAEAPLVAA